MYDLNVLSSFVDIPLKKKYVPKAFLDFCSQVRDPLTPARDTITLTVTARLQENDLTQSNTAKEIICKYKKKMLIELQKHKEKIMDEIDEIDEISNESSITSITNSQITTIPETQPNITNSQISNVPETQTTITASGDISESQMSTQCPYSIES